MQEFDDLVVLMDRLRGENGCPWDREQTPQDLRGYLLEEAYEVVDAIDDGKPGPLREELGDLLFQIVFLARIHAERGEFTVRDVARDIAEKMTRRHPHVFADSTAGTSAEVLRQWEDIKRREKEAKQARTGDTTASALDGVPRSLPALLRAERLGTRASRAGFDWTEPKGVLEKIEEEIGELRRAVDGEGGERVAEEFGDVLFALANLARHLGVHSEGALQGASDRFVRRYRRIEEELRLRGSDVSKESPEELDRLWRQAKKD
jgi:tetrapyrrole methylase family protein/MazG family protein